LAVATLAVVAAAQPVDDEHEQVRRVSKERIVTPVNQIVQPEGRQVNLPGLRPQALALSPDGRILVTSGKNHDLVAVDPATGEILQTVAVPADSVTISNRSPVSPRQLFKEDDDQLSFTGLIFSPDGARIYLSNVGGSLKVFTVNHKGHVEAAYSIPLPAANAPRHKSEIPAGLAFSKNGKRLYAALNMGNRLAELDPENGGVLRTWDVGVAPYDVVCVGDKVFVSNWGGRRPDAQSITGPAGRGTVVRVDPVRYIASEGSVSVIDLKAGKVVNEILTGKHACAMALAPDRRRLAVANAGEDTISIIDTRTDGIVETICARRDPGDLFGASPNALAFDSAGRRLFVCNGSQNALAIFDFKPGESRLRGLVPVGWYPGAVVWDRARRSIYVANIKGMGDGRPGKSGKSEFNTHQHYGSVTLLRDPQPKDLAVDTQRALAYMRYPLLKNAALPARAGKAPVPVPERAGEPSVFKHVVYLIKENRTYDQVLGDMKEGNGDAELCVFGERVTPNQHKFCRDFVLLDNTYCSGILSADGHEWATTAFATDYMERLFAGFPRSYPDGCDDDEVDAIAYSPAGFIWDDCLAHGKTIRDYGEFTITRKKWAEQGRKGEPKYLDAYRQFVDGSRHIEMHSDPGVESLRPHIDPAYIGWDLNVPDVARSAEFIREFRQHEASNALPEFIFFSLPNDHTSGTDPGSPTPAAQVADNDLAFGQIVDAISHSKFWPETCIFAIEDDPQSGWDHVSGYRTTAYVISAYCKRGAVVSAQYNQTSLLRTMELILGLPPLNQMDATATPMSECFTNTPNLAPFVALTNNIPLDQMNPEAKSISDAVLRKDAYVSARLPLSKPDQCPDDVLNRILWRAMKGSVAPYPAWAAPVRDDD